MISAYKQCLFRLYLLLFVGRPMSCLCYLCLLAESGVQHQLCCVFCFACHHLVSCVWWCPKHIVLCFLFCLSSFLFCLSSSCVLCLVVSKPYCVVLLFSLSSSCVLCTLCCQFLWIVHLRLLLWYSPTLIVSMKRLR